ncbi:phosphomannomutase/phosphoglucomutase [candidate division WWE3 bacterium]|nr:phosphomannomutase/phosphoglucomutase [candidate division WWE3 bacterium]
MNIDNTSPKVNESNFRNYDVRGEYLKEIDETTAYHIGRAFVEFTKATNIIVGGDMRTSTPSLKEALIQGILEQGANVSDIGLSTTDGVYFATHHYPDFDGGIMVTASHMPQQFNGFKFLNKNLEPIGKGFGMEELYQIAHTQNYSPVSEPGTRSNKDIWSDYKEFVLGFANIQSIRPMKVVMDAGNGLAGFIVNKIYLDLHLDIIPLYFEPDGTFPNHDANPILPENRIDIINKVKETDADLGIAWDADCDRVYFIDEKGNYIDGDFTTVLLGLHILERKPGAGIVYDIRASHAVKDLIEKAGGKAYAERVGHSYIKRRMRQEDAEFGGEVSGHYYFKRNAYAENGFIAPLMIMERICRSGKSISELIKSFGDYFISGEINSEVHDQNMVIQAIAGKYADAVHIDYRDGITVEYENWHFNVRPSANDPVMRLNLEANSKELMEQKRDELLSLIRSY